MNKTFAAIAAVLAFAFAASACNTVKGVGRDVQKVGSVVESAAK